MAVHYGGALRAAALLNIAFAAHALFAARPDRAPSEFFIQISGRSEPFGLRIPTFKSLFMPVNSPVRSDQKETHGVKVVLSSDGS
jgi:hypothetical protein